MTPERAARDRLLKFLAKRELSVAHARQRLARWGVPTAVADRVLADLQQQAALDDRRAAEGYVRAALARRAAGRAFLVAKLRAFGIDSALAAEVTSAALAQRDPREDAKRLCEAAIRASSPRTPADRIKRRLAGMLMRRGFDLALALEVANRVAFPPRAQPEE